jgi:DNA-binding CsgD family transcriptional regulator
MKLVERGEFLASLQTQLKNIEAGEGHCIFVSGEAGIGKTSLVKAFLAENKSNCLIYQGACDALFTPRPLAPLYDIMWQVNSDLWPGGYASEERSELFAIFFRELSNQKGKIIIVFEDIHWADEATLDFIKFFARRISHLRCLFILTYRDDEIYSGHPLKNVLGHLPTDSLSRLKLTPLSRTAVEKMAEEKGYNGEDVYNISGGNPFYVNEIMASYSPGVPENIKDSILSVYYRQDEKTKHVWEILSILPMGFDMKYLEKAELSYAVSIQQYLDTKILVLKEEILFFKHELYRKTIEASLSPLTRVRFNKKMLDILLESGEKDQEVERIVHHAKNANEYETVVRYAPLAARQAAAVGAHIEASKLYLSAIEYYQGTDKDILIEFYEGYAYECYLINQIEDAIIYTGKSLNLWKEKNDKEKIGNSLRFLSRLWWFAGNRKQAEAMGEEAIDVLRLQPSSKTKAMAYSNMSQLKMLSGQSAECIFWGEQAIAIAQELDDEETLSHALNNVGSIQLRVLSSKQNGIELLNQSLAIALRNSYHEHAARAYMNLGINGIATKEYAIAGKALEEGIHYCEERDLDSWTNFMLSLKAKMKLETGRWEEAYSIADAVIKKDIHPPAVKMYALDVITKIKMRRGDQDVLPFLLEAKNKTFEIMGLQNTIHSMMTLLEYEWITGKTFIETEALDRTIDTVKRLDIFFDYNEFAFWLRKARKQHLPPREIYEGYQVHNKATALKAGMLWEQLGCPYEQALALFEGTEDDKRKAITIVHMLGANAVYEKMKFEMRASGIKSVPRGIRKTTRCNPAFLTGRELDVLQLLKGGLQNKEVAAQLFISAKTVDHHISSILFKLDVNSRTKAVNEALRKEII